MTRSKQTKRPAESQPPASDDSDGYVDEGLAESRRKIARKQAKWLDGMTVKAEEDRVAFGEKIAEMWEQCKTQHDDTMSEFQQLCTDTRVEDKQERKLWKGLLQKSLALSELYDRAEAAVASDLPPSLVEQTEQKKKVAESQLLGGMKESKAGLVEVDAIKGVEKGVLRFAKMMG